MVRALLRDLAALRTVRLVTARAACLPALRMPGVESVVVRGHCWKTWRQLCMRTGLLWPIAPETGGALVRLSALGRRGGSVLGCAASALQLASSKLLTLRRLRHCGVPVIPTCRAPGTHPGKLPRTGTWVLKPDDGAGAEGLGRFKDRRELARQLRLLPRGTHVLQPWLRGLGVSLSLLCAQGRCRLLTVNLQNFRWRRRQVVLESILVGGLNARRRTLEPLAKAVAAAIPGLWGLVGVDLLLTRRGPLVLEINPRLTTSYLGLGDCLGINPVTLVLELARGRGLPRRLPQGQPVRVDLNPVAAG